MTTSVDPHISYAPLLECVKVVMGDTFELKDEGTGTKRQIAYHDALAASEAKIKSLRGNLPSSHFEGKSIYVQYISELLKMQGDVDHYKKDFAKLGTAAKMHGLEQVIDWSFAQGHNPHHHLHEEHGEPIRNR